MSLTDLAVLALLGLLLLLAGLIPGNTRRSIDEPINLSSLTKKVARKEVSAIEHYRDELGGLVDAGIKPLVTLHHFNLPGWLADAGGWLAPEATEAFLRFVRRMVTDLGDIVDEWIPINEPNVYAVNSYLFGLWPPDEHSYRRTIRVLEILATAHIAAYELIHRLQPEAKVGTATHLRVFAPANPLNPWHQLAAHINDHLFQRAPLRAMSTEDRDAIARRVLVGLLTESGDLAAAPIVTRWPGIGRTTRPSAARWASTRCHRASNTRSR